MGLRWQIVGDIAAFTRGSVGESALRVSRGWNLAGVIVGKAIFVTWAIVIPLLVYPWWAVLGAYLGFAMIASLIMATTFQLAHCVEEARSPRPRSCVPERPVWAVHEVETTVDFCPRNPRADLDARRPQLPDRASPVPARAAYALPADRRDRAAQLRQARHPLLVATVARAPRCARTSCTCARWAGSAYPPRSRWANPSPDGGSLDLGTSAKGHASACAELS